MTMETVIKAVSEAGIGIGSILTLAGVLVYQMKIMSEMSKNIQANTQVTLELRDEIRAGREVDKSVLTAIEFCRSRQSNKP